MTPLQEIAKETIGMNKQALVFLSSRASAEKAAEDIAKLTDENLENFSQEILKAATTPTKQCKRLASIIKKGIAFHHAGLLQKQRELIENEFRKGNIKVICSTPTLAAGLSLPAFRVIIKTLKRFSKRGMDWIPVLEYLQMAGRAGRPEYESYGESIIIATTQANKEDIYERYICGEPEEIYSKLAVEPVLREYLLSLIASRVIRDEKTMLEFFEKTFWAHQFADMNQLKVTMNKILLLLKKWEFITLEKEQDTSDFTVASNLTSTSKGKIMPTLLGKRVSELYLDPLTARHLLDSLANYDKSKDPFSLLHMISHTLEMRPLLRIKAREENHIHEQLSKRYENLLQPEPSVFDMEYSYFLESVKTALFFESWIGEVQEDVLLEQYNIKPGDIRAKITTADWLLYASQELASLQKNKEILQELQKLRIRLKYGVREELLPLLKLKGVGRVRARKLYKNGIKDVLDLKKVDISSLSSLVGGAVAKSLKEQVGQKVQEVPKGKRKGQLSLNKY